MLAAQNAADPDDIGIVTSSVLALLLSALPLHTDTQSAASLKELA